MMPTTHESRVRSLLCLATLAFAGCSAWSASDSVRVFDTVCERVEADFYDPKLGGLDWDNARREHRARAQRAETVEALGVVVNDMLALLRTSHTHFYTDQDPRYYQLRDIFDPDGGHRYTGIGIVTERIAGAVFVRALVPGGPAEEAGLRRGCRLVAVDGEPFHAIESFVGKAGKPVVLRVEVERDRFEDVRVTPELITPHVMWERAVRSSARTFEREGRRIGYVRLLSYAGQKLHDIIVEEIESGKLAGADALVMDLRDGWGGANLEYLDLFHAKVPQLELTFRDGKQVRSETKWKRPVVLLVNEGSRSGKDLWAYAFKKHDLGPVVGARTAGAVVGGRPYPIAGRTVLYLAVADATIDGERLEGNGVEPDVPVADPLRYCNGEDPQLQRALDVAFESLSAARG